jgi:hypothetical protein
MRKLILATVIMILGATSASIAQQNFDIRVSPLALITGDFKAGVEFVKSDHLGIELSAGYLTGSELFNLESYDEQGFEAGLMAKYYFKPKSKADGFYGSMYGEYVKKNFSQEDQNAFSNARVNVGFMLGKKWLMGSGFFIEGGLGLGRSIYNENTVSEGSNTDLSTIAVNGLQIPGRVAIGIRF